MAKPKPRTQQELNRQRKKREEKEKVAYLPPGFVNHGNTCFMNSVLQGLLATQLLSDLAYFNPINPEIQRTATLPIVPSRSPQLLKGHSIAGQHHLPPVSGMPIGDVFLDILDRAWFAQACRRREIHSPRALLTTLGRKYDQYLDFAQQDAHEFLRILLDAMRMEEFDIIKVRQPPPQKKRRRTTLTPASVQNSQEHRSELSDPSSITPSNPNPSTSPQTNDVSDEKLPLMSFVDMIFGGQLTSILVCQKCKHVSQTYEDFNDISLSLKPEDYRSHRNRERFKKFVGRLTSFPSTSSSSHTHGKEKPLSMSNAPPVQVHSVELVHSSRVPSPTNKRNDDISSSGSVPEEPPTSALGKRVLNSVLGGSRENIIEDGLSRVVAIQDHDAGLEKERDSDCEAESDGSHIIVNVTGPEDRHVEFVEPKKERVDGMSDLETKYLKERKHDEATWAKLGRRLSLNLGLGRQRDKEKDKQERERKTKSMDRSPLAIGVIKEGEYCDTQIMPKSLSIGARPSISNKSNSLKNRVLSEGAARDVESSQRQSRQFTAFTTTTPKQDQSLQPASQDSASLIAQKYPTVQRSRSPKPPKPTLAETQYLRKVLADVSPPSNNPLLMLRPSLLQSYVNQDHPASRGPWDKEKEKNPWLGLGARPFTGIEECLRMFTAVEVLDGENMVGCRRCWKIQNGVLQSKRDDDSDQEDEDGDDGPLTAPITPSVDFAESAEGTRPPLNMLQRSLSISSPTSTSNPVHIQASQSTPTVSFYSQPDSRSLSPLPTSLSDANLSTLHTRRAEENCSDSPLSLSIISEGSIYSTTTTKNNDVQLQGPGGLPIPIISTTAPIDAPEASTSTPSVSSSEYNYSSASEGLVSPIANSQEQKNRANAYARLTGEPSNVHIREPHQASYSRDSLVIPSRLRYGNRKVTSEMSTDDGSSGDETDTSTRSSVSVESATSASHSSDITGAETSSVPRGMYDAKASTSAASAASEAESLQRSSSQNQLSESGRLQRKSSKSKSVIMRPAYKRYLVATPPPVLVIHLKRFQQTSKAPLMLSFSNGFKKLDDYVSFPEFLDLSPFLSPRKEDYGLGKKSRDRTKENGIQNAKDDPREERCMYRLYTVVVHIGNMLGGHYIAYTALPIEPPMHRSSGRSSSAAPSDNASSSSPKQEDGDKQGATTPPPDPSPLFERQWAYISDTVVRLTTLEEVLSSKAYVCMYERC